MRSKSPKPENTKPQESNTSSVEKAIATFEAEAPVVYVVKGRYAKLVESCPVSVNIYIYVCICVYIYICMCI